MPVEPVHAGVACDWPNGSRCVVPLEIQRTPLLSSSTVEATRKAKYYTRGLAMRSPRRPGKTPSTETPWSRLRLASQVKMINLPQLSGKQSVFPYLRSDDLQGQVARPGTRKTSPGGFAKKASRIPPLESHSDWLIEPRRVDKPNRQYYYAKSKRT